MQQRSSGHVPSGNISKARVDQRPRRLWSRVMILVRRVHLYAGLFLLPWVLLYGITGAMFNHVELFPVPRFERVDHRLLHDSPMADFPSPEELAENVAAAIAQATNVQVKVDRQRRPEFTSDLMFEVADGQGRHAVHLDPLGQSGRLVHFPKNPEDPKKLLGEVKTIRLKPDPHESAKLTAQQVLEHAGIATASEANPIGWTKLNFLAAVDGVPARITYVLKDGHVDVDKYTGDDGMFSRQLFLRLHTSHGQPPHWNARMCWSLAVDATAIAMVVWSLTGIVMWWQIKRTRWLGLVTIGLSLLTACAMYYGMIDFYATTRL